MKLSLVALATALSSAAASPPSYLPFHIPDEMLAQLQAAADPSLTTAKPRTLTEEQLAFQQAMEQQSGDSPVLGFLDDDCGKQTNCGYVFRRSPILPEGSAQKLIAKI